MIFFDVLQKYDILLSLFLLDIVCIAPVHSSYTYRTHYPLQASGDQLVD